jgi:anti-sigma factor RsiW
MKHRPFEDWLLDDQPLDPTQKRELNAHLRACNACRAIAESNLALRSARVVAAAPTNAVGHPIFLSGRATSASIAGRPHPGFFDRFTR